MKKTHLLKKTRFLFALFFSCVALSYASATEAMAAQNVSVRITKGTLEDAFKQMMEDKHIQIVYEPSEAARVQIENINYVQADAKKVLDALLAQSNLTYEQVNGVYTIKKKALTQSPASAPQKEGNELRISGIVFDDLNVPLPGASIRLKAVGQVVGTVTNPEGRFTFPSAVHPGDTLVFSFIGMEAKDIIVEKGKSFYNVTLGALTASIGEVVVNAGIIQRDKHGFTGAYTHATGEELKAVGSQNILQSLQALDPSFIIADNSVMGSSPNAMPNIEIRGQSAVDIGTVQDEAAINPNQPLFIMDGFEATLQEINDLDMNRVESITILKDAGSTAIYGSRGANGVVVIETVKPKRGQMFINYNGDFAISYADLTDYNMMNAAEKLQYELLAGRYNQGLEGTMSDPMQVYNEKLAAVNRGVNTYWLKVPIRTAFTQKHSASVSLGSDNLLFLAAVNYGRSEGVMKGENRETFGGNMNVTYRKDKINISNNLTISGYNSENSPYAPFSNFVNANPYYTPRDENGDVPKFLERFRTGFGESVLIDTPNPLYNALLDSESSANSVRITNNTNLTWYVNDDFMISGALSINHNTINSLNFISADHTKFDQLHFTEKGTYSERNTRSWSYDANIYMYYKKTFADVHNFTLIGRGSIKEDNTKFSVFEAMGFPSGAGSNPNYASSYTSGRPMYSVSIGRKVSGLLSFSYNYKLRYIFDANYTVDGANTFGSNKKFAPFWSVGAGWHLKQEAFAKDWDWLTDFTIRGNYGVTASQNVQLVTESTYQYFPGNTVWGQGISIRKFGNYDLDWEQTKDFSLNLDAGFLEGRLKFNVSYFDKKTDPRVFDLAQKPSTGMTLYAINMGNTKNRGTEFMVTYSPIYRVKDQIYLTLRASGLTSKMTFGGLSKIMENSEFADGDEGGSRNAVSSVTMRRYRNGYSPDDLWAVKSLGVDPATGREVFLKKDGVTPTFEYDSNDIVKVGSSRPTLQGTLGIAFKYKQFETNIEMQYRLGGDVLNRDLYDKVENIRFADLAYNQDKRALYDKWKQPGDVSKYITIDPTKDRASLVQPTSRFVQEENTLSCKTIRLSWDFTKDEWIKTLKLSNLRVSMYLNDIFRISSVKQERSTSQPFQRQINFSLSTRF